MFIPTSCIKSPGKLLQVNKGQICFSQCFQSLCDEFEMKFYNENPSSSMLETLMRNKAIELLSIAEKMLSSYGVRIVVFETINFIKPLLNLLKVLIHKICSFPKSLLLQLSTSPLHICGSERDVPFYKPSFFEEENWFIASSLKSKEEIIKKVHRLVKSWLTRTPEHMIDESQTVNLDDSNEYVETERVHIRESVKKYPKNVQLSKIRRSFLSVLPATLQTNITTDDWRSQALPKDRSIEKKSETDFSSDNDSF